MNFSTVEQNQKKFHSCDTLSFFYKKKEEGTLHFQWRADEKKIKKKKKLEKIKV